MRRRIGLLLQCFPEHHRSSRALSLDSLPHCQFVSGEESSPGRNLSKHHVVLLSNLCVLVLYFDMVRVSMKRFTEIPKFKLYELTHITDYLVLSCYVT